MVLIVWLLTLFMSAGAWASGTPYGEFSFSQWQDSLSLLSNGGSSTRILEEPTGICPGAGYRESIDSDWSWDVNGCAFFGTTEANVDATSGSSATYRSKNNSVYGLQSAIGFLWNPGGIRHQIGIEAPLLLRHTSVSASQAGDSFSHTTALQTGLQIDLRFYSKGAFWFNPKLAWFQTSHTGLWSLNFAMDL